MGKTNYPGFVYAPNSGAIKQPADVGMGSLNKKKISQSNSNKKTEGSSFSISSIIPSFSIPKGVSNKSSDEGKDKRSRKVKRLQNKIEATELKEELRQVKRIAQDNKIDELNESIKERGKTGFYYLSYTWIFLDSPWKKGVLILFIAALLGSGYQFISDKITFSKEYNLYKNEDTRLENEAKIIDSLLMVDIPSALVKINSLVWTSKSPNQMLADSIRFKQKHWRRVKISFSKK